MLRSHQLLRGRDERVHVAMDAWISRDGEPSSTDLMSEHFEILGSALSPAAVGVSS